MTSEQLTVDYLDPDDSRTGNKMECTVCLEEYDFSNFFFADACGHMFCTECVADAIKTKINEGKTTVHCLANKCPAEFGYYEIQHILQNEPALLEKYERFLYEQSIEAMDDQVWCPVAHCGAPVPIAQGLKTAKCINCNFKFCMKCKEEQHENTCEWNKKWKGKIDTFEAWREANGEKLKDCPGCGYMCEKVSGCDRVPCAKCHIEFCWRCGQKIDKSGHFDVPRGCVNTWNKEKNEPKQSDEGHQDHEEEEEPESSSGSGEDGEEMQETSSPVENKEPSSQIFFPWYTIPTPDPKTRNNNDFMFLQKSRVNQDLPNTKPSASARLSNLFNTNVGDIQKKKKASDNGEKDKNVSDKSSIDDKPKYNNPFQSPYINSMGAPYQRYLNMISVMNAHFSSMHSEYPTYGKPRVKPEIMPTNDDYMDDDKFDQLLDQLSKNEGMDPSTIISKEKSTFEDEHQESDEVDDAEAVDKESIHDDEKVANIDLEENDYMDEYQFSRLLERLENEEDKDPTKMKPDFIWSNVDDDDNKDRYSSSEEGNPDYIEEVD